MPYEGVKHAPPPRTGTGAAGRMTAATAAPAERKLGKQGQAREEAANGVGQIIAFGAMAAGQFHDAGAIGMHWPGLAHEAAVIAETDAGMAKGLDYLLEVGPYGKLIILGLPFLAQLLVNHGVLKAEAMAGAGVVHPDTLTAKTKAEMARKAMEAIRAQQDAERELQQLRAEMTAGAGVNGDHAQ